MSVLTNTVSSAGQLTDDQMWAMYLTALQQSTGVPNFRNVMLTSLLTPININTATQAVTPTTPTAQALYQVYKWGNPIPQWGMFYTPSGTSDLFGQYNTFVRGIKLQGSPDPAVQVAINADRQQLSKAQAQYNTDFNTAISNYTDANAKIPGFYKSFQDYLNQTMWSSTLAQDNQAILAAQSQLDRDMTTAYGSAYQPVQSAINACNLVSSQMSTGGNMVMQVQTDAGTFYEPIYNPDPLGNPGFSQWLDQVVVAAGQGAQPQVSVSIGAGAQAVDLKSMTFAAGGSVGYSPFFWTQASGSVQRTSNSAFSANSSINIKVQFQAVTYLSLQAGPWFQPSMLSDFSSYPMYPDSPLANKQLWGPQGVLNVLPQGLIIAFRPSITAQFDAATFQMLQTQYTASASTSFGFGPFGFSASASSSSSTYQAQFHSQNNTVTIQDLTTAPKVIGVACSTPNYTG